MRHAKTIMEEGKIGLEGQLDEMFSFNTTRLYPDFRGYEGPCLLYLKLFMNGLIFKYGRRYTLTTQTEDSYASTQSNISKHHMNDAKFKFTVVEDGRVTRDLRCGSKKEVWEHESTCEDSVEEVFN